MTTQTLQITSRKCPVFPVSLVRMLKAHFQGVGQMGQIK